MSNMHNEEEGNPIPNVLCHLSTKVAYHQIGHAYGTLSRISTKLIFNIEDHHMLPGTVERKSDTIEIEDVAAVEVTKLSEPLRLVNVIVVERHMHESMYFRYFTHFAHLPFFGTVDANNQLIIDLCEKCITKFDENEYCKNEQIKILNIEKGCKELGKAPEFTKIDRKKYDSLFLCYAILAKIQPEDDIRLFTLLVDNGFDITKSVPGWVNETTFNTTLINFAVKRNLKSIVEYLLQNNVDINKKSMGQSPLHIACSIKSIALCELLFNYHADINSANNYGDTPLSISINLADINLVQFLLEKGATITPEHLLLATKIENLAIIQALVEKFLICGDENAAATLTALLAQSNNNDIKAYLINKGAVEQENLCLLQ